MNKLYRHIITDIRRDSRNSCRKIHVRKLHAPLTYFFVERTMPMHCTSYLTNDNWLLHQFNKPGQKDFKAHFGNFISIVDIAISVWVTVIQKYSLFLLATSAYTQYWLHSQIVWTNRINSTDLIKLIKSLLKTFFHYFLNS